MSADDLSPIAPEQAEVIADVLREEYEVNPAFRALIDAKVSERLVSRGGNEDMPKPELLTVDEAAAIMKVAPKTIREWLKAGTLKGAKVGPLWRIREEDLEALIAGKPTSS